MNEKLIKTFGMIAGGFVAFIFILFLISSCSNTKYTYEKLEDKMLSVMKSYYKSKEDELPSVDKDSKTTTLKKMISDGYIDELTELFDDENIKCDGNVTVTNNNGFYNYSTYLSCGKDYQTTYLKDKIIDENTVESGVGLYAVGNDYVFKGEVLNNYITFAGSTWRIMRIKEDGSLRIISEVPLKNITWDDRYNEDKGLSSGINEYVINDINSRLKDAIENAYEDSSLFSESDKQYIVTQTVCIGKRAENDTSLDGSSECSKTIAEQTLSTINVYEFLQASLDTGCNYTEADSCTNYNWLSDYGKNFWTITANAEDSRKAYKINSTIISSSCNSSTNTRLVAELPSTIKLVDGDGTLDSPYTFE